MKRKRSQDATKSGQRGNQKQTKQRLNPQKFFKTCPKKNQRCPRGIQNCQETAEVAKKKQKNSQEVAQRQQKGKAAKRQPRQQMQPSGSQKACTRQPTHNHEAAKRQPKGTQKVAEGNHKQPGGSQKEAKTLANLRLNRLLRGNQRWLTNQNSPRR